jgi:hypothetical protein
MSTLALLLIAAFVLYALLQAGHFFFQEKFLFRSKKLSQNFKHPCELPHDEYFLATPDGESINALLIHPEKQRGLVIYYHGNMRHLANYLPYVSKFTKEGFVVLLPDYRGFGKSTGNLSQENFYADSLMVFDWASARFPGLPRVIYGRSMGTAAACFVAAQRPNDRLILEAPFYNLHDLYWFYGMMIPNSLRLKFSFPNNQFLPNVKSAVTIFHGTKDAVVAYRSGKKLQALLKEGDRFITIKGGRHNNLERFELYHTELEKALRSVS